MEERADGRRMQRSLAAYAALYREIAAAPRRPLRRTYLLLDAASEPELRRIVTSLSRVAEERGVIAREVVPTELATLWATVGRTDGDHRIKATVISGDDLATAVSLGRRWPAEVEPGWLSGLLAVDGVAAVAMRVRPLLRSEAMTFMTVRLRQVRAADRLAAERGELVDVERERVGATAIAARRAGPGRPRADLPRRHGLPSSRRRGAPTLGERVESRPARGARSRARSRCRDVPARRRLAVGPAGPGAAAAGRAEPRLRLARREPAPCRIRPVRADRAPVRAGPDERRADRPRSVRPRQPQRDRPRPDRDRQDDVHRRRDEPLLHPRHPGPGRRPARRLPAADRRARRDVRRARGRGRRAQPVRDDRLGDRRCAHRQARRARPGSSPRWPAASPATSDRRSTGRSGRRTRRPASARTRRRSTASRRPSPISSTSSRERTGGSAAGPSARTLGDGLAGPALRRRDAACRSIAGSSSSASRRSATRRSGRSPSWRRSGSCGMPCGATSRPSSSSSTRPGRSCASRRAPSSSRSSPARPATTTPGSSSRPRTSSSSSARDFGESIVKQSDLRVLLGQTPEGADALARYFDLTVGRAPLARPRPTR